MEVTTNITKGDILHFNLSMIFRLKANWYLFLVIFIFALIALDLNQSANEDMNFLTFFLSALFCAILGMIVGLTFSIFCILMTSTEQSGVTGEHQYFILPEGLQEKTKVNESLTKWNGIKKPLKNKSFIMIPINAYMFHILPRRSFKDQAHFEEFWSKILSYYNAEKARY